MRLANVPLPGRDQRRARVRRIVVSLVLLILGAGRFVGAQGTFSPTTGTMPNDLANNDMVMLADGRVLIAGGINSSGTAATGTAAVYEPSSGTWSLTGSMNVGRSFFTTTLLKNGKVLVTGGMTGPTAELYDPVSGTWSVTGSLITPRVWHSAFLLNSGKVLVVGGIGAPDSAELYDPDTGHWSPTTSLDPIRGKYNFNGVVLQDGRVLVAGAASPVYQVGDPGGEIYDPASSTWSATGPMSPALGDRTATLTVLADGKVLALGGLGSAAAQIFDPATNQWTPTTPMPAARGGHVATLLLDGTVLVTGGVSGTNPSCCRYDTALLYNPFSKAWTSMPGPALYGPKAIRLLDGRVLVAFSNAPIVPVSFLFTGQPSTLQPLLTLNVSAPTTLAIAGGTYASNPFPVTATIANIGAGTTSNVEVSAFLPDGLTLATGALTQSIGDLSAGEHRDVVWTVRASGQKVDTTRTYFVRTLSSNTAGQSVTKEILLPGNALTIDSITPTNAGDTGPVTVHLNGGGILPGATVTLLRSGESDLTGDAVSVIPDGFSASATFDLTGKARGVWSVMVSNPGGTTSTLADALSVEAGRTADVWVDVVGPSAVRGGRATTFYVQYGNRGNVDSDFTSIWVSIPASSTWHLDGRISPNGVITAEDGTLLIHIDTFVVPAGGSGVSPIVVMAPAGLSSFHLEAWVSRP